MAIRTANNQSLTEITAFPSAVALGGLVLLETQTASSDATIDFTSNIDSTYKEYIFKLINIHPATNDYHFMINFSIDSGSNYNVTKTSSYFRTRHSEDDTTAELGYSTGFDVAQSTGDACIYDSVSTDNDGSWSGELKLFNPSSTTFVKHFISRIQGMSASPLSNAVYAAGYGNTTSAVDGVRFLVNSGNIDAGTFKLYGVT